LNPTVIYEALGDLASLIALIVAFFNLKLIWSIHTNHLPHIYEALRRIASSVGVDISDLDR